MRKILRVSTGVGLVIIGIIGCLMPVIPGFVFLIPGLVILAEYSTHAARLLNWCRARFEDARRVYNTKAKPTPSATMEDRPDPGQ